MVLFQADKAPEHQQVQVLGRSLLLQDRPDPATMVFKEGSILKRTTRGKGTSYSWELLKCVIANDYR